MKDNYEDIIDLPHHVSPTRPQMSMTDRAAQFSPFAALVGFDDEIKQTIRLTNLKFESNANNENDLDTEFGIILDDFNNDTMFCE